MGKRVAVLDPNGVFGTVDETDVAKLPEGAKVLTKQELAAHDAEEAYAEKTTGQKALGLISPALPAPAQAALRAHGAAPLPPELEAYREGASSTFTGGLEGLATKGIAQATGGQEAADKYVADQDLAREAHPDLHTAGQVAGVVGATVSGGAGAAGKIASPLTAGASAAGGVVERAVGKGLAGLAAKGALGRAAAEGAATAARGAAEGAIFGGVTQATDSALHDEPVFGQKLYGAIGHGALAGGVLGGVLGTSGSLVGSAARGVRGALARRGAEAVDEAVAAPARGEPVRINPDAGLGEAAPEAEQAFKIGPEAREVGLRPNAFASSRAAAPETAARRPFTFRNEMGIDPDAGLYAPQSREATPLFSRFTQGSNKAGRRAAVESGLYQGAEDAHNVQLAGDVFRGLRKGERLAATTKPIQEMTSFRLNPDAGLSPSQMAKGDAVEDVFRFGKARPRDVELGDVEGGAADATASPIKIGEPEGPAPVRKSPRTLSDYLSDPREGARALAQDQAFRAFGGGFGLQSTRFAKQAQKYFPNGTKDLGEIGIRYGLIDSTETGSPLSAAWKAAKEGTPEEIAPKVDGAVDRVGSQIGEITDASGARVSSKQIRGVIDSVASKYENAAATRPVGRSIRAFGDELLDSLGLIDEKGTASLQDVLRERKAIDRISFKDNATLDPKSAVAAKRQLSGALEDVIENALDDASGQLKGELKTKYNALKRDYHGLRIIQDAVTDSAARQAKAGTFGLRSMMAAGSAIASGNIGLAPALAIGGKLVTERGNAAAAAFLTRAADSGAVSDLVARFNANVKRSASGVLRQAPQSARETISDTEGAAAAVEGKAAAAATRAKAQQVVKFLGDVQANPQKILDKLEEEGALVSRAAGANAATGYTMATIRALQYLQQYVPTRPRRDPLDPRSVPPMNYEESTRVLRAATYATHPETVFADFDRGVVTAEGIKAAKTFLPDAFAEFQQELMDRVTEHMLAGNRLTQTQRLRIDKLLGYPAGADLRPAALGRLQANLMPAPPEPPPANGTTGRPVDLKVQQSGFDAIEARHATG